MIEWRIGDRHLCQFPGPEIEPVDRRTLELTTVMPVRSEQETMPTDRDSAFDPGPLIGRERPLEAPAGDDLDLDPGLDTVQAAVQIGHAASGQIGFDRRPVWTLNMTLNVLANLALGFREGQGRAIRLTCRTARPKKGT